MDITNVPFLVLLVLGAILMFIAVINTKKPFTPNLKKLKVANQQTYINMLRKIYFITGLLYFSAGFFFLINLISYIISLSFMSFGTILLSLGKDIIDKKYLTNVDS